MSLRKILYPIDFNGNAVTNHVTNEVHSIGTTTYRAFTLNFTPFFADSLVLKETGKTVPLIRGTDYDVLYFFNDLTKLAGGKEVCGVVVITNTKLGTSITADYQTVGGHYCGYVAVIQQAIIDLDLDNRNADWANILNKPETFAPTQHLHDIGDAYGFEFLIDSLIGIREAIMVGDNEVHAQILARIDEAVDEFKQYYTAHLADVTNPHKTTAHQVGAYTKEEIDELFMEIMNDFGNLEPRFKNIADGITDIYSKISTINATLKSMSDRIGYVELELSKFVSLLSPINQTLALLQGQIDNINLLISALQAKDKNLQDQIDALDLRLDAVELRNTQQDTRLDNLESNTANHDLRLGVLETWKIDAAKTLVDYDVRLDDIETKNASQDNRLTSLETWKTAQQTWDNNITNSVNSLSTRLTTVEQNPGGYYACAVDLSGSAYVTSKGAAYSVIKLHFPAHTRSRTLDINELTFTWTDGYAVRANCWLFINGVQVRLLKDITGVTTISGRYNAPAAEFYLEVKMGLDNAWNRTVKATISSITIGDNNNIITQV